MKSLAFLLACSLLPSCAIHVHVHEASEPVAAASQGHAHTSSHNEARITGIVRDTEGAAVEARVALVGAQGGGSNTMTTQPDGRFALPEIRSPELALHASTEDGRAAVVRSHPGARDVELVVRPGATLVIELAGREKARLAVFADGLRIEDFTLKQGDPATLVVPPGEVRLQLYDRDTVFVEREVSAAAGSRVKLRMEPNS